jgi:hypothetical protein
MDYGGHGYLAICLCGSLAICLFADLSICHRADKLRASVGRLGDLVASDDGHSAGLLK